MGLIRKTVTKKFLAANSSNSRRSTGPKTALGKRRSSLNAAKHLVLARVSPAHMKELGEDPAKFDQLRQSLYGAFRPQDDFERILVEEMAEIKWRLQRLRRAETGLQASQRRKYELDREWALADRGKGPMGEIEAMLMGTYGLAGAPNSAGKYSDILLLLRALRSEVLYRGFREDGVSLIDPVYGRKPGLSGFTLKASYKSGFEEQERQKQAGDEKMQTLIRASFIEKLDKEIDSFSNLARISQQRDVEVTDAMKDSKLLPSQEDLEKILRYETSLERLFERKLQQLVAWWREKQGKNAESGLEEWTREEAGDTKRKLLALPGRRT